MQFNVIYRRYPNLLIYLAFLALAVLAFWQVAFLKYSLKWDMVDCYLPWRYFTGECLQNNILPLWNPYQHLGYPIHADLRSVWYPEVMLIGALTGYTNYTLHFLFIIYISLAGFGLYILSCGIGTNRAASFITGTCYMLSGYFVGRGQDIGWIIAAAWLPFVIHYYLKLLESNRLTDILLFCLFTFLLVTGGYQAHSIILAYLLFFLFLYYFIRVLKSNDYRRLGKIIVSNVLALIIILVTCSVLIVISVQVIPYINRLGGLPLSVAQWHPFSPESLLSLLVPYATVIDPDFFSTDISMRNAFTGIIIIVFFMDFSFRKKHPVLNIILVFGMVSLLASLGKYLPVREFIFDYVPGMNMFRMPYIFVLFFMIAVFLIGGAGISNYFEEALIKHKSLSVIAWFFVVFYLAMLVFTLSQSLIREVLNISLSCNGAGHGSNDSLFSHILINSFFQLIILLFFLFCIYYGRFHKIPRQLMFLPVVAEMILSVQMNMHYTVVSENDPSVIHRWIKEKPSGFPVPAPYPLSNNSDKNSSFGPLMQNTNIFSKSISYEGFNSFLLKNYEYLFDSLPGLKDAVLKNPLVYLSGNAGLYNKSNLKKNACPDPSLAYVPDSVYNKLVKLKTGHSPGDTAWISSFRPDRVTVNCSIKSSQIITLIQADYPGWEVIADHSSVKHFTSAGMFISALIPAGTNTVEFIYSNRPVLSWMIVSYSVFLLLLVLIIILEAHRKLNQDKGKGRQFIFLVCLVLLIIAAGLIIKNRKLHDRHEDKASFTGKLEEITRGYETVNPVIVMNVENPGLLKYSDNIQPKGVSVKYFRFNSVNDLPQFSFFVEKTGSNRFIYAYSDVCSPPGAIELIRETYPEVTGSYTYGDYSILCFAKSDSYRRTHRFFSLNDMESENPLWTKNLTQHDSSLAYSGKYSCRIDKENPFSITFISTAGFMKLSENCLINITAEACLPDNSKVSVVVELQRNGKQISYESADIAGYAEKNRKWNKVLFTSLVKNILRPDDLIKIYAWNYGSTKVNIDNMTVAVDELP